MLCRHEARSNSGAGAIAACREEGLVMNAIDVRATSGGTVNATFARLESLLVSALQVVTAILVAVEIVVLFAGILARYVFHVPLVWSDEVASILFLWLGILGSALAVARSSHLRMTTLVTRLPARWRSAADSFALAVGAVFMALLLWPSWNYLLLQSDTITATLGITMTWRAMAMPVGFTLMLLIGLLQMRSHDPRSMATALIVVLAACVALYLLRPHLIGLGRLNLALFFVALVPILVFSSAPIGIAFGMATLGYIELATRVPGSILVARIDAGMSNFLLISIPLFVFLGLVLEETGMAARMVRFLANLIGHRRGGLHYVLVAAMYLVSGISGSKAADMAAIAPALFPEMEKYGADRAELAALLAATGAQTETIPPSLILITIGSVTGLSIAALFAGGLLPALVAGVALCTVVWRRTRKGPAPTVRPASARIIATSFIVALPALALPFIIRSAVIEGVATATEVSTIGIVYTMLIGLLFNRRFDFRRTVNMLVASATLSGAILLIVGTATAMAWAITQSGFSHTLAQAVADVPGGRVSFIALSILLFTVLGSVLEGLPAIVLFGPLMFPIARSVGVDEIHYAMIVILSMGLGLFTPPFGIGYYISCAIGGADPNESLRHIWGYLVALALSLLVVASVPWLSTGFR
jgi:tripartite ATP-independent transporter DctM subunit